jgi:superfamily II DNA or RNA helicase/HKD family nuclease
MTLLRPRWIDDDVRAQGVVRPDEHDYRIVLASEAQRVSGALAFALEVGDQASIAVLSGRLRSMSDALGGSANSNALVAGDCVRIDVADRDAGARLFVGGSPSFWDGLRPLLRDARELDIVVAYATTGGIGLLRDLLTRTRHPLRFRMLLGSYLGGTRPDALRAALDLFRARDWAEGSVLRFIGDPHRHFHPKVYRVVDDQERAHLAVGSANLSRTALDGPDAVEWNTLFDVTTSASLLHAATLHIERLLSTEGEVVSEASIERLLSGIVVLPPALMLDAEPSPHNPPVPNRAQTDALAALGRARSEGYDRALVVAATGLGKTVLAALDSLSVVPPRKGRILFVAHREELLLQARRTFEAVRGDGESSGLVKQHEHSFHADLVFASVFSLDRIPREQLATFDYVVIDEAHHAAAKSYEALFSGVVAYEMPLLEAIAADLLVPFRYFGIPDTVDYRSLTWVGGSLGYREADLERAVVDEARMERVLEALAVPGREGKRSLFFCVSIPHAEQTADALDRAGFDVRRVDSSPFADDRATAIGEIERGEIDAIVSVDMFNEGIDIPSVDRVVLLRPTDSRTVFLQQLGRGLRKHDGKTHLTVIDLVGNHRRVREHLALLGIPSGSLSHLRRRFSRFASVPTRSSSSPRRSMRSAPSVERVAPRASGSSTECRHCRRELARRVAMPRAPSSSRCSPTRASPFAPFAGTSVRGWVCSPRRVSTCPASLCPPVISWKCSSRPASLAHTRCSSPQRWRPNDAAARLWRKPHGGWASRFAPATVRPARCSARAMRRSGWRAGRRKEICRAGIQCGCSRRPTLASSSGTGLDWA